MNFINETAAINGLADYIVKSGVCLYNAVKYIYSLAENDFYNIDIRDVLKVIINNFPETDGLKSLGLRIDDYTCRQMQSEEYNKVLPLMVFSLAVRIPVLKNVKNGDDAMTDDQLYKLYTAVIDKGAENYREIITESFLETKYLVRKGKKLPPFTADWFKSYILSSVPALSVISNKNLFLLGFSDTLFAIFYTCMEDGLSEKLLEYADEDQYSSDGE